MYFLLKIKVYGFAIRLQGKLGVGHPGSALAAMHDLMLS